MIGVATIRPERPAGGTSAFWEAVLVLSFKDIAVACPCRWEMTFAGRRVSGWRLVWAVARCPYHRERRVTR